MKPLVTMRTALSDEHLLGSMLRGESWNIWRTLLIASQGEALDDAEMALFRQRTGRETSPDAPVDEFVAVSGRRSGKTLASACLALYRAALCDWSKDLARGETGVMLFLSPSQRQSKVVFNYVSAALEAIPLLRQQVVGRGADSIDLKGRISIEIKSANFRNLRGLTLIGAVCDELAFWFSDELSRNPDAEILAAVRPAMSTTRGMITMCSTPYSRKGELWQAFKNYGPDGDPRTLVAWGSSKDFNSSLDQALIDRALSSDFEKAQSEFLGRWRDDIAGFVTLDVVQKCIERGVTERAPEPGVRYVGFIDPSGGSMDSMTLGIAHREGQVAVVDHLSEVLPKFDPSQVVDGFTETLKRYGVKQVYGDRYGGGWVSASFWKKGVGYVPSPLNKSQLYLDLLPQMNSGRVRFPDNERLVNQLVGLERRTSRGTGMDVVDHGSMAHDDLSNAAAGAVLALGFGDVVRKEKAAEPDPPGEGFWTAIKIDTLFNGPRKDAGRIRL